VSEQKSLPEHPHHHLLLIGLTVVLCVAAPVFRHYIHHEGEITRQYEIRLFKACVNEHFEEFKKHPLGEIFPPPENQLLAQAIATLAGEGCPALPAEAATKPVWTHEEWRGYRDDVIALDSRYGTGKNQQSISKLLKSPLSPEQLNVLQKSEREQLVPDSQH
jgi:hypothetical protein